MPTARLIPSTYSLSNTSYFSVSNASNAYANTDSTNYATFQTTSSSTSSRYIYLKGFNLSTIPLGAQISSFTIKIKGYESGASTSTSYAPCLVNNTTTISNTTASQNFSTSSRTITIPTGSLDWDDIVGYGSNFGIRINARRSSRNTASYVYIYGAEIEVTYTNLPSYTITASSAVTGITVSPSTQSVLEGSSATVQFDVDDITNYQVTDNDVDVTSSLVRQQYPSSGSVSETATSFTTGYTGSNMAFYTSSSTQANNFNYAVGHTAQSPGSTSSGSGSWTYVKQNNGSTNETGYADFVFDFSSIPSNATITTVQVQCYGAIESTSETTAHADITLYSGTTQKGTTQKFTSTSNSVITLSNVGTWTRAELQNAKLRFAVGYYGGHIFGITWNVSYTMPTGYYYEYTLNNVTASHVIVLEEAGVFVPPEEDPTITYWPITISSINATTDPGTGTTRVEEGTNQTITIYPTDPQLTLALDNGVDVTSQLQGSIPQNTYTVTTQVSGASYGFTLNNSTGYYTSTNTGQSNSAAVCRVNFTLESDCLVTINYINYAEATYDYGIFGQIDTALRTSYSADSNPYLACSTSTYNTSTVQTLTYNLTAGSHYIDIKYRKDSYTDENNDSLQWKIASIEATGGAGHYTYTLNNVNQKHSLIFVFGNVNYYFITSTGTHCKLFPDGQIVKLQGDSYSLTIVPDDPTATVTLLDNNVNQTSSLIYESGQDKYGNTVVNYTYNLTNISATHALTISCVSSGTTQKFYMKDNGSWVQVSKVYQKINGSWVEQTDLELVFDSRVNYVKG